MRILVAEDDRKVASFIEYGLKEAGHVVDLVADGREASMQAHVGDHDLILLDINLPHMSGFEIAAEVRREGRTTPILMLTSHDRIEDVVRGLDSGADDYLPKPFPFDELLARIRALARRSSRGRTEVLRFGPFELDRLKHVARANNQKLDLTPREFQVLEFFMMHPNEVIRRTTLLEKVWDLHFDPETNLVNVHISKLRRKLLEHASSPRIETVRGVGFAFQQGVTRDFNHG